MEKQTTNDIGAVAGTIIVVLVLLVGGVYFFGERIAKQNAYQTMKNQNTQATDSLDSVATDAAALDFSTTGSDVTNLK